MSDGMDTLTGIVLAAYPYGDYDKRLTILTRERGKITAFAKGARRPRSPLLSVCDSFVFGEYSVYAGKSSYSLVKASVKNYFQGLRDDFEGACYGFYFCEIADYYTREENDEIEMLKLLYQSLRALEKGKIPDELVRYIYELKVLVVNGECPPDFDEQDIGGTAKYTLHFIAQTPVEKLYSFTVSEEVLGELRFVMRRYRERYMEGRFKSLEVLESLLD